MWYVYLVECVDGTFYTGITTDLQRRINEHNGLPKGAKYTKGRGPVKLVYSCKMKDKSAASKEEYRIKKLTRDEKKELKIEKNRHRFDGDFRHFLLSSIQQ